MSALIDLIGKRFGRWTVLRRGQNTKGGQSQWLCRCTCDNATEKVIFGGNLTAGVTKSCGCIQRKYSGPAEKYRARYARERDKIIDRSSARQRDPAYKPRHAIYCKRSVARTISQMKDVYIKALICNHRTLVRASVPLELVELKRVHLQIHRELKEK